MSLTAVRDEIREVFALRRAERESASLTASQRATVQVYANAARGRVNVARDIRGTTQTGVALDLYREASLLYALAFLVSRDETIDPASLSIEETLRKLDETLARHATRRPPFLDGVASFMLARDPLAADRLSAEEVEQKAEDFEATTRWLSRLFDARSVGQLRRIRFVRFGSVALAILVVAVALVSSLLKPKNLAKGKTVMSSGPTLYNTTAAGAVDGSTAGQFGFHSGLEDSPSIVIDLGRAYRMTSIKVFGRGDNYFDQSLPLALEVSTDGLAYKQVAERLEAFSSANPWIVQPADAIGQFVRVRSLRRTYLVLSEVEVYGQKSK